MSPLPPHSLASTRALAAHPVPVRSGTGPRANASPTRAWLASVAFGIGSLGAASFLTSCATEAQPPLLIGKEAEAQIDWPQLYATTHFFGSRSVEGFPVDHQAPILLDDLRGVSGLPVLQPVATAVLSSRQMAALLADMGANHEGESPFRTMFDGYDDVVAALGLGESTAAPSASTAYRVPRDDAHRLALGGLYAPERKAFYVAEEIPFAWRTHVIRHELMHALQDQSFDLTRQLARCAPDVDCFHALKATIEGQAEVAAWLAERARRRPSIKRDASPAVHADGALGNAGMSFADAWTAFQYRAGSNLFSWLLGSTGRDAFPYWVQETFAHPPATTREVYHPVHYLTARVGLRPRAPCLAALAAVDNYALTWESGLGEFTLQQYLLAHDGHAELADGFLADRVGKLVAPSATPQPPVIAWLSRWESSEHAAAFSEVANGMQLRAAVARAANGKVVRPAYIEQTGTVVGLLMNLPVAQGGEADAFDVDDLVAFCAAPQGEAASSLLAAFEQALCESQ